MAEPLSLPQVVVVTGTGTEVGKTMVTAALGVLLRQRGTRVAVVKPAQTGVLPSERGDVDEVRIRVGPDEGLSTRELVRLPDALAPDTAARRAGVELPTVASQSREVAEVASGADIVLVEGAGGLLVRLDGRGGTLADLGTALRYKGISTGFVLVVQPGLGTLNHTALTAEALAARQLPLLGVVIGSWPAEPDLAMTTNVEALPVVAGAPLLGRLPAGCGALTPGEFRSQVPGWFSFS